MNPADFTTAYFARACQLPKGEGRKEEGMKLLTEMLTAYIADMPKPKKTPKIPGESATDEAWIASLEAMPAYEGIDVRRELGKMQVWASANRQKPTRKRFVNWLNRAERPLGVSGIGQSSNARKSPGTAQEGPLRWRERITEAYPECVYAPGKSHGDVPWGRLDSESQKTILKLLTP
jgi:hypothetical protein